MEYDDRTHDHYFANVIDGNLYLHVELEGRKFLVLEEISDHQSDRTAIYVADGLIISQGESNNPKKTTHVWELITQGFSN